MKTDVTLKIAGAAGQGIQTIGDLLSEVCHHSGLFTFSVDDFESRVRGGHNFNLMRISDKLVAAPGNKLDILVCINTDAYELHKNELRPDGIAIVNAGEIGKENKTRFDIPLKKLAEEAGGKITANTVAAGAVLSMLGVPFSVLADILKKRFAAKGEKTVALNIAAARKGFDAAQGLSLDTGFTWEAKQSNNVILSGAKAAALGALAADCRFFPFYPMSPATGVLTNVVSYTDKLPVVVEQAEDEIAAVIMAIGASFAGVRAMTATSGGGFCLMTEGLGLAAMTETPLVILNAQRPGPATGLPTRTGQADLLFSIHASQDDFPRFVFAPGTPVETFETMKKAFHLAEKYQVPAIVLLDQFLADYRMTEINTLTVDSEIERFYEPNDSGDDDHPYLRYALTQDGVSPQRLPCSGPGFVRVTGNEHNPEGHISENAENKIAMTQKRAGKVHNMLKEMEAPTLVNPSAPVFLVGWGSTRGNILEAAQQLNSQGMEVGAVVFKDLWPMDGQAVGKVLAGKRLIMVEQNESGQLKLLLAQQTGITAFDTILKYDGRPFFPDYIVQKAKEILK
ncbi:2-oxoacid:acceptor oxidoreductase subunit alpha [uncultured Desulfobacter sp.]|uniref:2-oxoacid:acceptor oxidoreductase subunit alpha n=1 Tax=uncultured Desulfobacter sp. TaxID=240139 RepID=UPI002AAB27AB|nr:2-oxoacid:acceptor oxidoreductase subunit alpha [uncultured Desulfobacter sp.]